METSGFSKIGLSEKRKISIFPGQGEEHGARVFPDYVSELLLGFQSVRRIYINCFHSNPPAHFFSAFLLLTHLSNMVELRKRKAPAPPLVAEKKTKQAPKPKDTPNNDIEKSSKIPEVDDIIDIETFGGEIETNDGEKTSLKKLLEESKSGVVLFTYPKASTPGCKYCH
jgi:hypothetical protein